MFGVAKITVHLMSTQPFCMADINLFSKNKKELEPWNNIAKIFVYANGMEFGLNKCETLLMLKGWSVAVRVIDMPEDKP